MAQTGGQLRRLKWLPGLQDVFVYIGPTGSSLQVFILPFDSADPGALASRRAASSVLPRAMGASLPVTLTHAAGDALINVVDLRYPEVQVDAVEVTQAVQDLAHGVSLIAQKPTVVRVYLSSRLPGPVTVTGNLSMQRSGEPARLVASVNRATLNPADFGQLDTLRRDAAKSLNFLLPTDQRGAGSLAIGLDRVIDTGTGLDVAFSPRGTLDTVDFTTAAPLRVRIVGFSYQFGAPPVTHTPSATDFGLLVSWLGRAYPVPMVIASQQIVTASSAARFGCGQINAELAAIRALDVSGGVDARTHYYGLVSDGGFYMRGCAAAIPGSADPTAVASGPTGSATWGWDTDGSYGDWYGGHELGHTFGRLHPGFCGESHDDPNYPFIAGQLANADASFAGFDVGDPMWGLSLTALPGTAWHDVMTYCQTQWLSSYTYQGIRTRLAAEDALAPGAPAPGGGRPDERFPEGYEEGAGDGPTAPRRTLISLVARINLTRSSGRIAFVHPVARGVVASPDADGRVAIRTVDSIGNALAEYRVAVKPLSDLAPDADEEALCDVVLPIDPETTAIKLYVNERLADTWQALVAPPEVDSLRVAEGDANGVELSWGPQHEQEPGYSYSVQLSDDRGRTWRTVAVGVKDRRVRVHPDNLPIDRPVLFRVMASDGFRSTGAVVEWSPGRGSRPASSASD